MLGATLQLLQERSNPSPKVHSIVNATLIYAATLFSPRQKASLMHKSLLELWLLGGSVLPPYDTTLPGTVTGAPTTITPGVAVGVAPAGV